MGGRCANGWNVVSNWACGVAVAITTTDPYNWENLEMGQGKV